MGDEMHRPVRSERSEPEYSQEFLAFGQPQILEAEVEEVVACLRSGWLGTGPRVAQFEQDFARFKGVGRAAAVASCSAALHLSLLALRLEPEDEVITSPMTFCGTVNAVIHAGARPVLADIDPVTMNLDPRQVEARITSRTRAILPVHFAGRPCDMKALGEIASAHDLRVVEDCAHAVEAECLGRSVGTLGDFGCFSFYATKNVTTGEGGMIVARVEVDLEGIRALALHGLSRDAWSRFGDYGYRHYHALAVGFKYNMTDVQAAIGIHQLRRVEANWRRRRTIWSRYVEGLGRLPLGLPAAEEPSTRHAHHLYSVLVDECRTGIARDAFAEALHDLGIGVGVHYLSVPEHPIYQTRFGWRPEDYPVAMRIGRQTVSLPLGPGLTDADVERVIRAVHRALRMP
jgi:dTDP-4-amino-4,6-dideoxygalactose transaminase